MKKKATWATVGIIAILLVICFAVMNFKGDTSSKNQSHDATEKELLELWKTRYALQPPEGMEVVYEKGGEYENPEEEFFNEVLSQVPINELTGFTYEEFSATMEELDEQYNSDAFSKNAKLLFELPRKGKYSEYLIPAIICMETNGGTELKGTYNYWNVQNEDGGFDFDSPEETLTLLSKRIEDKMRSGSSIKQFAESWNPFIPIKYGTELYETMKQIEVWDAEKLSKEEKQLIDEVVSKIPIRESVVGLTKEEFVRKMERLDDVHNSSIFLKNAELFFEVANEEGYSEYFFPVIACQETVGGRFAKGDFNYWNALARNEEEANTKKAIVYKDGEKTEKVFHWRNFESEEDCIREFFATVEEHRVYDSATTLTEFTSKWCPNTANHPHQAERYAIALYEQMLKISNL